MRFVRDACLTILILVAVAGVAGYAFTRNGLSARTEPPAVEAAVARRVRSLAMPSGAKARVNPYSKDQTAWIAGGRYYQDHCAICHGENGSGRGEIGQNLYPKAPDMREPETQGLTDGELYFVIMNGVRYTGMPAWEGEQTPADTWRLVSFLRKLPRLTPEDLEKLTATEPGVPDGR
jgi:mono/diheme cytochrome c family protein